MLSSILVVLPSRLVWQILLVGTLALCACLTTLAPARAQNFSDIIIRGPIEDAPDLQPAPGSASPDGANPAPTGEARVTLEATLTDDGQPIDDALTWRVFRPHTSPSGTPELITKFRDARPVARLEPGTYFINAAFGRANLTRRVVVLANARVTERFVLNAGALRAKVLIKDGRPPNPRSVSIDIFTDESDQAGQRRRVVTGARPGIIIRLNSGIYHLQSRIGRSNAYVRSEVSVEAGKLTDVVVLHEAAPVTFRLVDRSGAEGIAGTRWTILANNGNVVRESVGALPTHILAPGQYTVIAQSGGQRYRRTFEVKTGEPISVEVLAQPS